MGAEYAVGKHGNAEYLSPDEIFGIKYISSYLHAVKKDNSFAIETINNYK